MKTRALCEESHCDQVNRATEGVVNTRKIFEADIFEQLLGDQPDPEGLELNWAAFMVRWVVERPVGNGIDVGLFVGLGLVCDGQRIFD